MTALTSTWTGAMAGIAGTTETWSGGRYENTWWLWRMTPDGEVLDAAPTRLAQNKVLWDVLRLAWSGEHFWIVGQIRPDKVARFVVACSCDDLDGDGFDACSAADCDDRDPSVHPGAGEVCRGGHDEDCNGAVDCADPACPAGPGPAECSGVAWDGTGLGWSPVDGAQVYHVSRGLLSDARRRGDLGQSECVGSPLPATRWHDDGRRPPVGDALWYLVRAEGAPCHRGPWGPSVLVGGCR